MATRSDGSDGGDRESKETKMCGAVARQPGIECRPSATPGAGSNPRRKRYREPHADADNSDNDDVEAKGAGKQSAGTRTGVEKNHGRLGRVAKDTDGKGRTERAGRRDPGDGGRHESGAAAVPLTGTHTARKRKHEASEAKLDKAPECARAIAQSKKQRLSMATTETVSAGAKKIGMKAVAATVVVMASAGKEKAPVASKKSVAPERPVKETTVPRQKKAPSSTADDKNGEGRAAATGEATARKKTGATETTKAASGKKKTGVIETKKAAAAAAASEERQGVSATTKKKTVAASGKKRTGAIETKKVVVSRKKKKTVPATAKKKIDVNETKRAVTTKRETVTAPVSAKTGTKGSAHGGRKKRRRNRRSRREQPPALAADDFAGDGGGDRRRWGSYLQMDAARKAPPYVGKTPDIVRRTKEHRRGDCKHTRRFQGDIAPVWFVDGGFGCDRDVQQYEWRMKHEYSPRAKFRRAFGGAEARALRDQATARIRVAPQTKPSANLDKALRALCSMLQITQWTAGAIPIGHEWRAALPKFVVHWFGPDPVCYGYDVKRLPTAYPVRHVFDCVLDGFTGSVASDE